MRGLGHGSRSPQGAVRASDALALAGRALDGRSATAKAPQNSTTPTGHNSMTEAVPDA